MRRNFYYCFNTFRLWRNKVVRENSKYKDSIKKEINSLIAKRLNFTTILIILITGIIGLMFNFKLIYLIPITLGVLFALFFANSIFNVEENIRYLIKEPKK